MRHRLSLLLRLRTPHAPLGALTVSARGDRADLGRHRPLFWILSAAAVLAAVFAILLVPPMSAASAATYGPGFDDADNGGHGRVGAYRFDGRNVYCLEPLRDRPLGTTTAAGDVGPSDFGVSAGDLAAVNWAISTHGQKDDPVTASAVAIFVWSVVANEDLAAVGTTADARMMRVPEQQRAGVRAVLAELRHGAERISADADADLAGQLELQPDPHDWRRGTVTISASDPAATAIVTLEGAVFITTDTAADAVSGSPATPGPGGVPGSSADPVKPAAALDEHSLELAPGDVVPYRLEDEATTTARSVRATATLTSGAEIWRPRLEAFTTPGAQLLGGAGGSHHPSLELEASAATHVPTFAPEITTRVESTSLAIGDAFIDIWMPSVADGVWLRDETGRFVPVQVTGSLYGPFDEAPALATDVPDEAPLAAIVTTIIGGDLDDPTEVAVSVSTADLANPVFAELPGVYVWVVSIDAAAQPEGHALPTDYQWRHEFGIPDETTVVEPPTPSTPPEPSEPPVPTEPAPSEPAPTPPLEPEVPQEPVPEEPVQPEIDASQDTDLAQTDGDPDLQWLMILGVIALSTGCVIAASMIKLADARADRRREAARH